MASIMSSTIVNVAIPDISHHFVQGQARAQWVSSSFMVATTVSMLTTPRLLARYSYRRTYIRAMVLLLPGRHGGGRGAGGRHCATDSCRQHPARLPTSRARSREQRIWHGPCIGGLLVDWFDWRSIFFMVLPFCIASIALA